MMRYLQTRRVGGFSLLEMMVTVSIATMGFVALITLQLSTLRGMANTRHLIQATTLAENFLERLHLEFMGWTENPGQGLNNAANFPHLAGLPTDAAAAAGARPAGDGISSASFAAGESVSTCAPPSDSSLGPSRPSSTSAASRNGWVSGPPGVGSSGLTRLLASRSVRGEGSQGEGSP